MIDNVEIPMTIMGFSTMKSSKNVPSDDCNNDRQLEIAIWSPKPEILIQYMGVIKGLEIYDRPKILNHNIYFITTRDVYQQMSI